MLNIAIGAQTGGIVVKRNLKAEARQAARSKRVSSLATTRGAPVSRLLPWPQFLAALEHRRDLTVRAHVRWCMRTAVRSCENLRRAEGRCFELRPGGRGNITQSGGMYHRHAYGSDGAGERLPGLDGHILFQSGRYVNELEDNLRKLLCPPWAIPVVKRAIRAKLALGWDLDFDEEGL